MTLVADFQTSHGDFTLTFRASFAAGSVVAVLGPNGAGKTTLLRTIAGLQGVDAGSVVISGRTVDDGDSFTGPGQREVGVVFQDYALFPHLSVLENVAFGPRSRGEGARPSRVLAQGALDRFGIGDLADRKPARISGGQAQRVALARALVTQPAVLLLDEPLAALDIETRETVRAELDLALADFPGCTVLVTHDPLDALLLADRIIVLEDGHIVQDAAPAELARRPLTPYVAALMGVTLLRGTAMEGRLDVDGGGVLFIADAHLTGRALAVVRPEAVTLLRGTAADGVLTVDDGGILHLADHDIHGRALAVVRPEAVTVHRHRPEGSARNCWQGTVSSLQPARERVRLLIDGEPSMIATVTPAAVAELGLTRGTHVWLSLKAVDVDVYPTAAH